MRRQTKRKNGYEVRYYLGILNLPRKNRDSLLDLLAKYKPETGEMFRKKNRFTIVIDLKRLFNDAELISLLLKVKRKFRIEITASMVSNYGQGGFDVPEWVIRLCSETGASFGFTYTCI